MELCTVPEHLVGITSLGDVAALGRDLHPAPALRIKFCKMQSQAPTSQRTQLVCEPLQIGLHRWLH
eukprot:12404656-Karenia_brevis.AAC.1